MTDSFPQAVPDRAGDLALCRRACAGDRAAQEAIYRAHRQRVYALALRMLCQPAAAEEVLQETFVKVLTRLDSFRGDAALATWITRVAANECLQILRSPWQRRAEVMPEQDGAHERPDRTMDLQRALGRLDGLTRPVVWLHDVEGFKHREIAELTGRTVSFSKSRLARGHQRLREMLDAEGAIEDTTGTEHARQY